MWIFFVLAGNLKQHVNSVHEKKKHHKCKSFSHISKDYQCDSCGKQFALLSHLKRHIVAVHDGKKDH